MTAPEAFVVAGPNGAGKTTLALEVARDLGLPYIGADAFAADLSPEDPASARVEAGRRFFAEIGRLTGDGASFVCESTLSGRGFAGTMRRLSNAGFHVSVLMVFVTSPDTCVARVAERVERGGHDVPEADVRRRFGRSLANFWSVYRPLADTWSLVVNDTDGFSDVASGAGADVVVYDTASFNTFISLLPPDAR